MSRALKPVGDRAILRRIKQEKTGRVITGALEDEKPQECVIVVPPDLSALKAGDHVFIAKLGNKSGWEVTMDGETYVVIDSADILAVALDVRED